MSGRVPAQPRRQRILPAIGCALGIAGAALVFSLHAVSLEAQEYRYGVEVEMVSVYVTVQDARGRLVTNLRHEDFIVYDNGVPQAISQFSREYVPLSVLILLDTSSSMQSGKKLENAKKALAQFLKRLRKGDEAMLVTFRTSPRVVHGFSTDFDLLKRDLRKVDAIGSTALYDSIMVALDEVARAGNRRRALLLISDGLNTYGRVQLDETISRLRREGVELFAIGLTSDLPEDMHDIAVTRSVMERLTRSAGGEAFLVGSSRQLDSVCKAISDRMHNQYNFGYYPPATRDGQWRTIRVETRVPDLKVIASKTGYFPEARTAPVPRPEERTP